MKKEKKTTGYIMAENIMVTIEEEKNCFQRVRLSSLLEDYKWEIRKLVTEQTFQSEAIRKLEKTLGEVENEPPFCVVPEI